jgi:hypothetical protein
MGEPDAGNPHVRFNEGGGNPAPTLLQQFADILAHHRTGLRNPGYVLARTVIPAGKRFVARLYAELANIVGQRSDPHHPRSRDI